MAVGAAAETNDAANDGDEPGEEDESQGQAAPHHVAVVQVTACQDHVRNHVDDVTNGRSQRQGDEDLSAYVLGGSHDAGGRSFKDGFSVEG